VCAVFAVKTDLSGVLCARQMIGNQMKGDKVTGNELIGNKEIAIPGRGRMISGA